MCRPRTDHPDVRERSGEDHEIPMPRMGRRWQDEPLGPEVPRSSSDPLRCTSRASDGGHVRAERVSCLRPTQVDDPDVSNVEAPEAATLGGRVDGASRGGPPLRPDGLGVQ